MVFSTLWRIQIACSTSCKEVRSLRGLLWRWWIHINEKPSHRNSRKWPVSLRGGSTGQLLLLLPRLPLQQPSCRQHWHCMNRLESVSLKYKKFASEQQYFIAQNHSEWKIGNQHMCTSYKYSEGRSSLHHHWIFLSSDIWPRFSPNGLLGVPSYLILVLTFLPAYLSTGSSIFIAASDIQTWIDDAGLTPNRTTRRFNASRWIDESFIVDMMVSQGGLAWSFRKMSTLHPEHIGKNRRLHEMPCTSHWSVV